MRPSEFKKELEQEYTVGGFVGVHLFLAKHDIPYRLETYNFGLSTSVMAEIDKDIFLNTSTGNTEIRVHLPDRIVCSKKNGMSHKVLRAAKITWYASVVKRLK